ncbi:MAG: UDP-N-acetylmuramoyl-L-alanine--D-glutamate ligase [Muribaculaceae bacterium]|nr:UDP-N-acetylmuramoyl-L-alanine--D-glutamate ligase [Muribaculaceae bacterium]
MSTDNFNFKRRLVILGGGESGVGAAVLAAKKGFDVWLSDMGNIADKYKDVLNEYNIPWEEGSHTESKIIAAHEVVKSPGIPDKAPIIQKIKSKNIPIISEIEFAGRYTDAKMVCITGSNGKTTTTLLTYHILKQAGINVGLAGNVGKSLAFQVATCNYDVYVIELSSFQLDNMYDFKANIAVIMNITPDHLDRYDYKMENYVNAKFRILRNQTTDDAIIFWQDDPIIRSQIEALHIEAHKLPFGESRSAQSCAWVENEMLMCNVGDNSFAIPRDELALPGLHNLYNSMAASLSAMLLNIRNEDIKQALSDFEAVEHRLEYVRTVKGVRYINDSKATNVNSTWYALESMTTPTVLILGGKDKGNDYSEIEEFVKQKVKAIVCLGKDNQKLLDFFSGKVPVIADTHSIQEAVDKASEFASEGDTVLLSPCCASFDLFKSYEDRGTQFKNIVNNL